MTTTAAVSNVIPMREFDRGHATPESVNFELLLRECQQLASQRLSKSVSAMLEKIEQMVWTPTNNPNDREARDQFALAKQSALSNRLLLQERFNAHFLGEFDTATLGQRKTSNFAENDLSSMELSLVDESDFEETLRVNEMSVKLRRYCDEEVVALDQRVGVLLGDATLQGKANPFSPQAVCNAYRRTCADIEQDVKIRLTLLKLFDDHVLDDIRSIYKDLNTLLVQHSILPKIRYGAARRAAALGGMRAPAAEVAERLDEQLGAGVAPAGGDPDFFAMLQGLMGSARSPGVSAGPALHIPGFPSILGAAPVGPALVPGAIPAAAGAPLPPAELMQSLTRLQHGDVSAIGGGSVPLAATMMAPGATNVLRELKATTLASGMGQTEGMTLDIVIMLFDQIFDDRKIPSAMKGLIGRLQIPTLKVAILDKSFFSRKSHPARRLLDTLGDIALQLPPDFGSSSPLYVQLDALVQKLIDSFQDDLDVFETMRAEVERLSSEDVQQADAQARDLAQEVEQKERLALAKAVAQHAIKLRVDAKKLPPVVVRFLSQQWVKLLLMAYAKHGADSESYKTAAATMDLLIWSVSPMQLLEERRRLATRLPGLLKRLNLGMQIIGTDEATRKSFFAKLMRCHTRIINTGSSSAAAQNAPTADASVEPLAPQDAVPASASDASETSGEIPVLTDVVEIAAQADEASAETPRAPDADQDMEPTQAEATFSAVTIPNPFGDGEIEVEEIDLSDFSNGTAVGTLTDVPGVAEAVVERSRGGDEHTQIVSGLQEGVWLEFRDAEDNVTPARLSYISPLKGTYLFVNRQGRKVGEYSLYQLAREFRTGRAAKLNTEPLFDRAMSSLVGVLKTGRPPA